MIVPEDERRSGKSSHGLSDGIGKHLSPGEAAENSQGQSDGGIQMGPGNLTGDVDAHSDGESPAQCDVGKTSMNGFAGVARGEQDHHGDHAGAEQDQNESAEKLRDQFRCQGWFRIHRSLVYTRHDDSGRKFGPFRRTCASPFLTRKSKSAWVFPLDISAQDRKIGKYLFIMMNKYAL